jgi:hypothetical protein
MYDWVKARLLWRSFKSREVIDLHSVIIIEMYLEAVGHYEVSVSVWFLEEIYISHLCVVRMSSPSPRSSFDFLEALAHVP